MCEASSSSVSTTAGPSPGCASVEDALVAVGGPDALCLRADVEVHGEDMSTVGRFTVRAGERRAFVLTWFPSHEPPPPSRSIRRSALRRDRALVAVLVAAVRALGALDATRSAARCACSRR